MDILHFMQQVYAANEVDKRKMRFMYAQSGIENRYSVIADYSKPVSEWKFYPQSENLEPFPSLEQRMMLYARQAPLLSVDAIRDCLQQRHSLQEVTHFITVSCTGMSAPGLDLQVMELLELPRQIARTSVNFMGCYAAIHALRMAHAICSSQPEAQVLIVCTELCTLHFQREQTMDNIASSLLFGDGAAAVLVTGDAVGRGLTIDGFYSEVIPKGKRDMAWELSSSGFLMTLSGYVPELLEADLGSVVSRALQSSGITYDDIRYWCIHPGGRRILEAVQNSLHLQPGALEIPADVLRRFGNLSSATILFVLKEMMQDPGEGRMLGAAFGPGLTVETFTAHY